MTLLHAMVYGSLLVFVIAILARAIRIAKTPIHLRWELYPVPHEKGRAHYGGSSLEEVDWWTKSHKQDKIGELRVMITEILFLKGIWEHNRPLWFGSWTLHFGLYLLVGLMGLQVIAAFVMLFGGVSFATGTPALIVILMQYLAVAGFAIGTIGAIIMFLKRAFDPKLRMYNSFSHFFNIIHLGAIYVTGLLWLVADGGFITQQRMLFASLFTFSGSLILPVIAYVHTAAVLLFFIYLPFTHMTHFFTKYFTYHDVRWEDTKNTPGGPLEEKIKAAVSQPVTWAAPHIQADGKKTWADLVALSGNEIKEEKN